MPFLATALPFFACAVLPALLLLARMIALDTELLPSAAQAKLREWGRHPGMDAALRLAESRCQLHQAQAIEEAVKETGDNRFSLLSRESMKQAHRYTIFAEVLMELIQDASHPEKLQIAKLPSYVSHKISITEPESE